MRQGGARVEQMATVANLLGESSRTALADSKKRAVEAQAELATLQADEAAREGERRQRSFAQMVRAAPSRRLQRSAGASRAGANRR